MAEFQIPDRIRVYDGPKQKFSSSFSKTIEAKEDDKGDRDTYGYKYILKDGRMCRRRVSPQEKIFKTDNVNSFASANKMRIRIGTRPQRYKKAIEPALCFENLNKEVFESNSVDLHKTVIVDGCFDTNRVTLERTSVPDVGDNIESIELPNVLNMKLMKKAIKATIRKIGVEILPTPTFDDCLNCKFNKDTKPGFTAEHILKKNTKKKALEDSIIAARYIWNNLELKANKVSRKRRKDKGTDVLDSLLELFKKDMVPGSNIYDIGARGKRDSSYEEEEFANSRAVHMPEFHNEIVMSPWVDSVTRLFKYRRKGPIYIGNSISDYTRYEKDMLNAKGFLEGDWKRFDSSLYARICIIAISILRCFYSKNDVKADSFFLFISKVLVIKDYYFPGGRIVRMLHGLPSGTKCTNLLGSIINLLCLNYCLEPLDTRKFSFAVGGDDFVIFCRNSIDSNQVDRIVERSVMLGMKFKFLDIKFSDAGKLEDYPYFFKYTVKDGNPYLKPADVLQRIFSPWNKSYNSSERYLNFLEDQFPQLGYPNCALLPFYSIYSNMYERVNKGKKISIGKVYLKHVSCFNKCSSKIFSKSLDFYKDEIHSFLKFPRDMKELTEGSKILLGFFPEKRAHYIYFDDSVVLGAHFSEGGLIEWVPQ